MKHLTEAAKKLKAFERANKQLSEQLKKQKEQQQQHGDKEKAENEKSIGQDGEAITPQTVMLKDKLRMEVEEKERWEQMAMQLKVK